MTAPGIRFETVDLNRPRLAAARTDICGFVGYTERGPIDRAVRVASWRQFLDAFGPPLPFANTGEAVRLYFRNGGDAAHVMRVTDPDTASEAGATLTGGLTVLAAYASIDTVRAEVGGPTTRPAGEASPSPGSWGNRLAVTVQAGGLGATRSLAGQPADGGSIRIESTTGFEAGSVARLIQDGIVAPTFGLVRTVDPVLGEIVWHQPLDGAALGLDFARPILVETVEVTLVVTLDGREVSRHRDVSLHPDHSRFAPAVLRREHTMIAATADETVAADPDLLTDPTRWPEPGLPIPLTGGRDGLATVDHHDFVAAIELLGRVDEISVLSAPDLVLVAEDEPTPPTPVFPVEPCRVAEAPPSGVLVGQVVDGLDGTGLAGVRAVSRDVPVPATLSDGDGNFTLTSLPLGQVGLTLERPGYTSLEATGQAFEVAIATPQRFELTMRVLPPALVLDEIHEVQAAMITQAERQRDRIALLDPPSQMLDIEDVQSWRNRFDTSYATLHWPWLLTATDGGETRTVPPSGAVAGLLARLDRIEGPQRAPANVALSGVQAVTHQADDATHGLLNEAGINVIRAHPGRGIAPQGARTLSSDGQLRYIGVRRLLLMIAEAIETGHQWAVFEPNGPVLRHALTHSLRNFLLALWARGAFAGATPDGAFAVRCDDENNPPEVADAGRVVADIAVAPVRPYEFIHLRLGRTDRLQVQVQE